ncbi:hypothetical protein LJR084_007920 [Variovorax sp. LjRoot84]|uniref:hypothetical protein n=1 Tax=Variovorax sp. LjRoot84 TaxID=3342340 RepID=UPI003ECC7F51
MQKTTWTLFAIIVAAAAGGGAYYLIQHQAVELTPSVVQQPPLPPAPAPNMTDDDLTRRKLEGIGSTRDLKPVPIPQGNAR